MKKMKDVIVMCPLKITENSAVASVKIAAYLAKRFGATLMGAEDLPEARRYETILYVNAPPLYAPLPWHERMAEILILSDRFIFVQNDYNRNVYPSSKVNRTLADAGKTRMLVNTMDTWSTIKRYVQTPRSSYVNWNMLTYAPLPPVAPKENALFYWGACRPGRIDYFKEYLRGDGYPVVVSTTKRATAKFREACGEAVKFVPPYQSLREIQDYAATLYIEDTFSHRHDCSPANRFYEAVAAGVAVFFEYRAAATFRAAKIDLDPDWIVNSRRQLAERLSDWGKVREVAKAQQKALRRDYIAELEAQIDAAVMK